MNKEKEEQETREYRQKNVARRNIKDKLGLNKGQGLYESYCFVLFMKENSQC